jgi:hypothetical protein
VTLPKTGLSTIGTFSPLEVKNYTGFKKSLSQSGCLIDTFSDFPKKYLNVFQCIWASFGCIYIVLHCIGSVFQCNSMHL